MKTRFLIHPLVPSVLLAATTFAAASPASAQWAVFDSSNYAQNLLTAERTLSQINNQIKALQNQATMLSNQAKNLTNISFPELRQLTSTLQKIQTLIGQAQGLSFNAASLDAEFARLFPGQAGTASTTGAQVANAQTRMAATLAGFHQTMATQSQIAENIATDAATLASLSTRSQASEGALQVAQASNQLLALTVKQQLQIQQMMAAQGRADATAAATHAQGSIDAQAATKAFLGSGTAYTPQ